MHHADHCTGLATVRRRAEELRQHLRAGGIMRNIQYRFHISRHAGSAPEQPGVCNTLFECASRYWQPVLQNLDAGQGCRRIDELMPAGHGRFGQASDLPVLRLPVPIVPPIAPLVVNPGAHRTHSQLLRMHQYCLRRVDFRQDSRRGRAHCRGFFLRYAFSAGTQPGFMINADRRDQGAIRIHEVHRIQPSAEPDFENFDLQRMFGKHVQRRQRTELEKRERHLSACGVHGLEGFTNLIVRRGLSQTHDALVVGE